MEALERRIPPVAVTLVFAALVVAAARAFPSAHPPLPAFDDDASRVRRWI